jgi:excisionase family DNA binding protein
MDQTNSLEVLWDSKQVATYLKLSAKHGHRVVERWVREGKLRAGRAGSLYRYRKQDVDAMLFSQR